MNNDRRTPPAVPGILTVLTRHGVRCVLVGSAGAVAHGGALLLGDLDICPALDRENLERLGMALTELRARPRVIPGWITRQECDAWRPHPPTETNLDHLFETALGDFDVVPRPYGPRGVDDRFAFDDLDRRAVATTTFGPEARVASLDDLIASKMSRRRDKDLRAFPELARLQAVARGEAQGEPLSRGR